MSHHRAKGIDLVARQAPGSNDIEAAVVFSLAEDGFLGATAIMEQHDVFG